MTSEDNWNEVYTSDNWELDLGPKDINVSANQVPQPYWNELLSELETPISLNDHVKKISDAKHVCERIIADLIHSRNFSEPPRYGEGDEKPLTGTGDWPPLMIMAYGYASRAAAAALYIQGVYSKHDYQSAKTIFIGLQLQTDHSVDFQENAAAEALKFMSSYIESFDKPLLQIITGVAEGSEIPEGTYVDDDEFFRRMEDIRQRTL